MARTSENQDSLQQLPLISVCTTDSCSSDLLRYPNNLFGPQEFLNSTQHVYPLPAFPFLAAIFICYENKTLIVSPFTTYDLPWVGLTNQNNTDNNYGISFVDQSFLQEMINLGASQGFRISMSGPLNGQLANPSQYGVSSLISAFGTGSGAKFTCGPPGNPVPGRSNNQIGKSLIAAINQLPNTVVPLKVFNQIYPNIFNKPGSNTGGFLYPDVTYVLNTAQNFAFQCNADTNASQNPNGNWADRFRIISVINLLASNFSQIRLTFAADNELLYLRQIEGYTNNQWVSFTAPNGPAGPTGPPGPLSKNQSLPVEIHRNIEPQSYAFNFWGLYPYDQTQNVMPLTFYFRPVYPVNGRNKNNLNFFRTILTNLLSMYQSNLTFINTLPALTSFATSLQNVTSQVNQILLLSEFGSDIFSVLAFILGFMGVPSNYDLSNNVPRCPSTTPQNTFCWFHDRIALSGFYWWPTIPTTNRKNVLSFGIGCVTCLHVDGAVGVAQYNTQVSRNYWYTSL